MKLQEYKNKENKNNDVIQQFLWVSLGSVVIVTKYCLLQGFALRKVLLQNYLYNNKKNIKAELVEHGGGNF